MKTFYHKMNFFLPLKNLFLKFFFTVKISFFLIFFSINSLALNPEQKLNDPSQEARAMELFLIVKCLVCNGQVIENSQTQFASDMRQLIRQKISQGLDNSQIKQYLIDTYGENIITEPSKFYLAIFLLLSLLISGGVLWFFKK
jgi:cytochrome c-type biogenesis protein CcmH